MRNGRVTNLIKLNQCFNIIKIKLKWKNPKQCNVLTYNMSYLKRKKKHRKVYNIFVSLFMSNLKTFF